MATANSKRNGDADMDDLYSTPVEALAPMFDETAIRHCREHKAVFYDPCDGLGDITDYLADQGIKCYRSDILKYRDCDNWLGQRDFLTLTKADLPRDVTHLIFNPPFKLTEAFVDKAHELGLPLLMFNRLTTLESNTRAEKFINKWNIYRIYVFGYRVSCTKGVNREATANAVAYAWYEFLPGYTKAPSLCWITKNKT